MAFPPYRCPTHTPRKHAHTSRPLTPAPYIPQFPPQLAAVPDGSLRSTPLGMMSSGPLPTPSRALPLQQGFAQPFPHPGPRPAAAAAAAAHPIPSGSYASSSVPSVPSLNSFVVPNSLQSMHQGLAPVQQSQQQQSLSALYGQQGGAAASDKPRSSENMVVPGNRAQVIKSPTTVHASFFGSVPAASDSTATVPTMRSLQVCVCVCVDIVVCGSMWETRRALRTFWLAVGF